jgi:hypothetical protein
MNLDEGFHRSSTFPFIIQILFSLDNIQRILTKNFRTKICLKLSFNRYQVKSQIYFHFFLALIINSLDHKIHLMEIDISVLSGCTSKNPFTTKILFIRLVGSTNMFSLFYKVIMIYLIETS